MHEAGMVTTAIDEVIAGWSPGRGSRWLHLEVVDGTRAQPEAVRFLALAILADRGLDDVTVTVTARSMPCPSCGREVWPSIAHPLCDCGAPLPSVPGPALRCREWFPDPNAALGREEVAAGGDAR